MSVGDERGRVVVRFGGGGGFGGVGEQGREAGWMDSDVSFQQGGEGLGKVR